MRDTKELLADVLELPERDRAEMAAKLLESLDGAVADEGVDEAWAAEIERRCSAVDAGDMVTSDWDDVRRRIERDIFRR